MVKKVILPLVAVVAVIAIVVAVVSTRGDSPTPPTPDLRTTGPWVDQILITEGTPAAAVLKLEQRDIDIWWMVSITDPTLFERIAGDPDIQYDFSYGNYAELMFNTAGPLFYDGTLNPFSDAKIREVCRGCHHHRIGR